MTHEKIIASRRRAMFWVLTILVTVITGSLIIRNGTSAQKEISTTAALPEAALAATQVYSNNFESAVGSEWRNVQTNQIPATSVTPIGARRFLGEFGNNEIRLSLNNLPAHNRVSVVFDLYVIRSWDGNETQNGPDTFEVGYDGQTLKRTTFSNPYSNSPSGQAFPGDFPTNSYPITTGASEVNSLGYLLDGQQDDSVYQISQAFLHTSGSLQLNFKASGLESLANESWGIDNVRVLVETIPNETVTTLMPYESPGYRYQILPPTQTLPVGFEQPNYNDSAWSVGQASFGFNDGCVFPFNVRTNWQINTRLILRKTVTVPANAENLRVNLSVDNDIEKVWFNGTLISRLIVNGNCPLRDEYFFDIPQNLVQTGNNVIAYQVLDRGRQTFFDSRITSNNQIACNPPTNGLVSWYRAEDTANDSFGNNNGDLQNGATFATGKIGQGFSFDGINDYVEIPNNVSLNPVNQLTIDTWINPNAVDGGRRIVDKNTVAGIDGYNFQIVNGKLNFITGGFNLFGSTNIPTNAWTHVAGVYDGSQLRVYVNGVQDPLTVVGTSLIPVNAFTLRIGADRNGGNRFNGLIDEAKIYNRALSATEINSNYQSGNNPVCQSAATSKPFDFDGDGKADVSVFRPSNGTWYLNQSQNGFTGLAFGLGSDKLVPADYDGDGKTDVAVFRNGVWYLQRSTAGFTGIAFGDGNDLPQPADFDGDGKAEIAVFRPSNGVWYVLNLVNNQFNAVQFGQNGDKPVAADYDGDGKADYAVYRNGTWHLSRSQLGFTSVPFGDANDKPVPADYDGDGKADVAVFRPSNGTWYLLNSATGFSGIQFGLGTDLPTPADYDGDGKADVAVFRNGTWYLNRTTAGFTGVAFGTAGDKPIPNAFVP